MALNSSKTKTTKRKRKVVRKELQQKRNQNQDRPLGTNTMLAKITKIHTLMETALSRLKDLFSLEIMTSCSILLKKAAKISQIRTSMKKLLDLLELIRT